MTDGLDISMHPDDGSVTLTTVAAGLHPTILIKVVADQDDPDDIRVEIDTWALPQDFHQLAEFFAGLGEVITAEIAAQESNA